MPRNPFENVAGGVKNLAPIKDTDASISYLGVRLEKADRRDSPLVPKPVLGFINDPELSLPLQRDIAIALLNGEPILVEGGTSLGKTTTVRKMCAELGYEVHYVNLNGATDVEDLMGRYVPNAEKHGPDDSEYRFADGKVTSGLRQEEGRVKVIILDEFNAAAPNILIRLHEVIDALERDSDVVLSEDASEVISTSKQKTKIIALMNPPGKGYFGREPLDPAQLRRWVYKKLPSELPTATFALATDTLFGMTARGLSAVPTEVYIFSRDQAMPVEQLQEIPGIQEILEKYKEFHKAAKELVKNRQVAEDQPQQFTYDDRMEPRRVRDFVLQFYQGDINETFQQALKYYYANKLESKEDRDKLFELIRLVEYAPTSAQSKRKGLGKKAKTSDAPISEESESFTTLHLQEKERIKKEFGLDFEVPPLPEGVTPEWLKQQEQRRFKMEFLPAVDMTKDKNFPFWKHKPGKEFTPNAAYGIDFYGPLQQIQDLPKNKQNPNLQGLTPAMLPGVWVLKDTRPKPNYDSGNQSYEDDADIQAIIKDLVAKGIVNQEAATGLRNKIHPKYFKEKAFWDAFASYFNITNIPGATVRLPRLIEQSVMGQRDDFNKTDTYEYSEEYKQSGKRLICGHSDGGGVSYVSWSDVADDNVGFRPLVVFSSPVGSLELRNLDLWKKAEAVREQEEKKLTAFFEKSIPVPPMPAEMVARLEEWEKQGMEVHYLPPEDMAAPKNVNLKQWKKKPNDNFYNAIKDGNFPQSATILPAGWFVIDARQKPAYADGDQMYDSDPFASALEDLNKRGIINQQNYDGTKKLKPKSRFGLHPNDFEKPEVIAALAKAMNVKPDQFSLSETMVWNIVANIHHPEWGTTNCYEWLKEKLTSGERLVCGDSAYGGVSYVSWRGDASDYVGFRPLVRFSL